MVLISGDRAQTAELIARQAGIEEVHADLAPNEKLEWIRRWQAAGHKVAMVGDGINDAPSLIAADVGLGMGAADLTPPSSKRTSFSCTTGSRMSPRRWN